MQGFELAYNQRSSMVDDIRKQVENKKDEIKNIEVISDSSSLDLQISQVNNEIQQLVDQRLKIEKQALEEKSKLAEEAEVADPNIERLNKAISDANLEKRL